MFLRSHFSLAFLRLAKIVTFVSIFASVQSGYAAGETCEFLFQGVETATDGVHSVEIEMASDPFASDAKEFAPFVKNAKAAFPAEILSMFQRIGSSFRLPIVTRLRVSPGSLTSDNAAPGRPELRMGVVRGTAILNRRDEVKSYWKHPKFSIPILRHEVGHIILNFNLAVDRPRIGRFFRTYLNSLGAVLEAQTLENRIKSYETMLPIVAAKPDVFQVIQGQIDQAKTQLAQIDRVGTKAEVDFGQPIENLMERAIPYEEFFADAVSVVFSEDPNAIMDAIQSASPPNLSNYEMLSGSPLKNFNAKQKRTVRAAFQRQNLRSFDFRVLPGTRSAGAHGVLWEVRQHVWKNYLATPSQRSQNGVAVLTGLYRSFLEELDWLEKTPGFDPMLNQAEANAHFIKTIDRNLGKLK